ncbi:MAG: YggS family pyridoxal phosphate-dependent enzyme [Saprospiraceae bacterium]|nr:YggS family pyridoxal phosphate-dependent enzyme [Saprospiraceae bacterium]
MVNLSRKQILQELEPYGARLVAVSKTQPVERIQSMYDDGQRIFGENRVQELLEKKDQLPSDIEWHLIGHLQRNKVKQIASFIAMIHSMDSIDLAREINRQAVKNQRQIPVLLQFRIALEETKFGITLDSVDHFMEKLFGEKLDHLKICGVMGMASFVENEHQILEEFQSLQDIFESLKTTYFDANQNFKEISMGMSGDYQIAIETGSTLVRIGSLLFGPRT